jgi:hypothetical protein
VRVDLPAEGDTTRAGPESHVADTPPIAGHEPLDRVACAAKYRETVSVAYHGYQAATPETADRQTYEGQFRRAIDAEYATAREPQDTIPGSWRGDGSASLPPEESASRETYLARYRALAEAEYREERQSRDTNLPAPVQASADSEKKLLHADADPLRAFGPASETHPAELDAAMRRLDDAGVEVDMRHDAMSYSPSAAEGQPGRLILDPEASYGAVLHEMQHFSDDEQAGFPGLRYWLEDPAVTAAGESRAYQVEIDYANSIGEAGIADQLEELRAQRIKQLLGENDE